MSISLHQLTKRHAPAKRVGRGIGSASGKTAGRGTKGQKSRSGHHNMPRYFEGGQMPLTQRLPKLRGFRNPRGFESASITTAQLERSGLTKVSLAALQSSGVLPRAARSLKVIGTDSLSRKLTVTADRASTGAVKAVEAAGGTIQLPKPEPKPSPAKAETEPESRSSA